MTVMLCGTPTYTPLCGWEAGGRWVYNKIYMVSYQGKVKYVCLKNEGRESQVIDECNENVCSDGIAYHKP